MPTATMLHQDEPHLTRRDRRVFAATMVFLGLVLSAFVWWKPESLMMLAWITGSAWCISMIFNGEVPRRSQAIALLVPLVAASLNWTATVPAWKPAVVAVSIVVFTVLGATAWLHEPFGRQFYHIWKRLFLPTAWTLSTLVLLMVYYGVITPVGLSMRWLGRDPMQRHFDPDAESYWVQRLDTDDPERYFRQF